ncbi:MAG: hypothetical protein EXQ70_10090 [Solirubrobacterales bacterium]|nr:hypothetical protein [Solirubrobacterales bacterium]
MAAAPGCGDSGSDPATTTQSSKLADDPLPPCAEGAYRLEQPGTISATAAVTGGAAVHMLSGEPCRLHTAVRFASRDCGGEPAKVRNNPDRLIIDRRLDPHDIVFRGWQWRNWRGADSKFSFTVALGRQTRTFRVPRPPRCESKGQPSSLGRFG